MFQCDVWDGELRSLGLGFGMSLVEGSIPAQGAQIRISKVYSDETKRYVTAEAIKDNTSVSVYDLGGLKIVVKGKARIRGTRDTFFEEEDAVFVLKFHKERFYNKVVEYWNELSREGHVNPIEPATRADVDRYGHL